MPASLEGEANSGRFPIAEPWTQQSHTSNGEESRRRMERLVHSGLTRIFVYSLKDLHSEGVLRIIM